MSDTTPRRDEACLLPERRSRFASNAVRLGLPVAVLAVGGIAYSILSREPAKPKPPPSEPQPIRTKVVEVKVGNVPVVIRTHGTIRANQESTLSAEVSGRIVRIHPAFEVGGYFSKGDVLVELDANDYRVALAMAEARLLGAKAALRLAILEHERNLALFRDKLVSDAAADQAAAVRAQAAAEVDSAAAQVERTKRDLERTQIRAPFDGRVRYKSVGLGQSVGPGTSLGGVFTVDSAEVRLPIAGRELPFLKLPEKPGEPPLDVELRDALDGASATAWKARIVRVDGALDDSSLELFAIARVEDPFGLRSGNPPLRIGQPVTAFIAGEVLTNVVALPRAAVRQLDQVVLIDKKNLTLTPKTILPIWGDEHHVVVRDPAIHDGVLISTTQLVYAPLGSKVEIIPDIPAALPVGTNALARAAAGVESREGKAKP